MEKRVSGVLLIGIFTLRVPSVVSFGGGAESGLQSAH
jgi:hypothetical protein